MKGSNALIFIFLKQALTLFTYQPVWVTSPYVKSASADVIAFKTGNLTTPNATIPFPGSAFSLVPNLGYGAINYQGDDGLASQMFQINCTSLTTSSFSVLIQITGFTHINLLTVRFIAIDKLFPHSLNSYDNVPVNYSAGPIQNISVSNQTTLIQSYFNVINFTQQSAAFTYKYFSTPLSNNKILLFLTSLFLGGINDDLNATSQFWNPVTFLADYEILTFDTYKLMIQLGIKNNVSRLHYSMIIFDQAEVQASGNYKFVYERIDVPLVGYFIKLPTEFMTNFIIGLTNFTSVRTRSIIFYCWQFMTYNGQYGLYMAPPVTYNTLVGPVTKIGLSYFYLKTWNCLNQTYYDPVNDVCTECPIVNCINCFNVTVCATCDQVNDYYLNVTTGKCQLCYIQGCLDCNVQSNNSTNISTYTFTQFCLVCDASNNYGLTSTRTCQLCQNNVNIFLNISSLKCELCTTPYCLDCLNLTVCQICDYNNNYVVNTIDGRCLYCDPLTDKFINVTTYTCTHCSLAGCLDCGSLTSCLVCDQAANYFLNPLNSLCSICTIPHCIDCLNLTVCQVCDFANSYVLDSANIGCVLCDNSLDQFVNMTDYTCDQCVLLGCLDCTSLIACGQCDQANNYFVNTINQQCQLCTLTHCLICLNLTYCQTCDVSNSYGLNVLTGSCVYCDSSVDLFLNTTTQICTPCSLAGCLDCGSLTSCLVCDQAANYFLNPLNSLCSICTIPHCIDCLNLTVCQVCDFANSYVLDSANIGCVLCDNSLDQFVNMTDYTCDQCVLLGCLDCTSLTTCGLCDAFLGYSLSSSNNLCQPCSLNGCFYCPSFTSCSICQNNLNYFLNTSSLLCQLCQLQGCLTCTSLQVCLNCDSSNNYYFDLSNQNLTTCGKCNVTCRCQGYVLPWNDTLNQCSSLCSDGFIRIRQQCDDGNLIQGDGCSSNCLIQEQYSCEGEPSICNLNFKVSNLKLQKTGCHDILISIFVEEGKNLYQSINKIQILNQGIHIDRIEVTQQCFKVYASYSQSILQVIVVKIGSKKLQVNYSNILPLLMYEKDKCQIKQQMTDLFQGVTIISYIVLLLSLIVSCKIVGLQLFGVFQLCYFSLSSNNYLVLYLEPLIQFRRFNGLNLDLFKENASLPDSFQQIGVSAYFVNNCNIMLILMLGQLIVALILYAISNIFAKNTLKTISQRMLKEGFITFLMFNVFNLSFSIGTNLKYVNSGELQQYLNIFGISVSLICIIIAAVLMEILSQVNYGQYKNKFKNNSICKVYIPLSLAYRCALGLYISTNHQNIYATLLVLMFSFVFILYNLTNLPFKDFYQNYRANFVHLTQLICLLTSKYYRTMKSNTSLQVKGYILTPALVEIFAVLVTFFVSLIVLGYQIMEGIKNFIQKRQKNKVDPKQKSIQDTLQFL